MGRTVYIPTTWMVDFYSKLVGKYTVRPMDATWVTLEKMGLKPRKFSPIYLFQAWWLDHWTSRDPPLGPVGYSRSFEGKDGWDALMLNFGGNMTIAGTCTMNESNEDVFPIEDGDFPGSHVNFWGVYITYVLDLYYIVICFSHKCDVIIHVQYWWNLMQMVAAFLNFEWFAPIISSWHAEYAQGFWGCASLPYDPWDWYIYLLIYHKT